MKERGIKIVIVALVLILIAVFHNNVYNLEVNQVSLLKEWTYKNRSVSSNDRLNLSANEKYTLTTVLPENFESSQYLLIRNSLSNFYVTLDETIIHKQYFDESKPMASMWHLVKVPEGSNSKQLHITYYSPFEKMNGIINPVHYGHQGDLMFQVIQAYGKPFIIDMMILLFGFLLVILGFVFVKDYGRNFWNIGLLAIFIASWLIAESRMLQFFTGSQVIIGSLAYVSLAIIPIPLLNYLHSIVSHQYKRYLKLGTYISYTILGLIILLDLSGVLPFFETLFLTHGYMVLLIPAILFIVHQEIIKHKNEEVQHFLNAFIALFLFTIIELVRFHRYSTADVTVFIRLGILAFILVLGLRVVFNLINMLKKSYKAEFYEQLALKDQLTQGPNRTAYERDLERIFSDPLLLTNLRLVILDLNQLKQINDVHGHIYGDEAIKKTYDLIHKHFQPIGKSYRIGGDEFACIIVDSTETKYEIIKSALLAEVEAVNKNTPYQFGIALGSVTYNNKLDNTVSRFMHRADTQMYLEKNIQSLA